MSDTLTRGVRIIVRPRFVPEFLARRDTQARIAGLRHGAGLGSILSLE